MAAHSPGSKIAIIKYALGGSGLADGVGYGNWHYDTRGFVRLGTAFAEAMIELETECAHTE